MSAAHPADAPPRTPVAPLAPAAEAATARRAGPVIGSAGLSVLIHTGILGLFSLATWAIATSSGVTPEYRAEIVSEPRQLGRGEGFKFAGRARIDRPDSTRARVEADTIQELAALLDKDQAQRLRPVESPGAGLEADTTAELQRADIVGVGTGGGLGSGGPGSGLGDRDLAGGGPVGSLWGVGENQTARSVVYVMDRSGSMSDTFSLLQRELMRAIGSLNDEQLFNVIWFNEGKAKELFPRLKKATLENKRDAFAAIKEIVPSGQTDPMDAVRRALNYRPDVMFLLSDGDFGEQNRRIISTIAQRNKGRATLINTILFVYDTMGDGENVLRQIAVANGGVFKHVTEEDLRD